MMTIILGPVIINSNEGILSSNIFMASPTSTSKVVAGAGSFNTGDWITTNNFFNSSSTVDPDTIDSNIDDKI
ncbi:spore germination protein [Gracilibacillus thailandensis]|nr:spore germination protein [Gracilibacillus thailandensis]